MSEPELDDPIARGKDGWCEPCDDYHDDDNYHEDDGEPDEMWSDIYED